MDTDPLWSMLSTGGLPLLLFYIFLHLPKHSNVVGRGLLLVSSLWAVLRRSWGLASPPVPSRAHAANASKALASSAGVAGDMNAAQGIELPPLVGILQHVEGLLHHSKGVLALSQTTGFVRMSYLCQAMERLFDRGIIRSWINLTRPRKRIVREGQSCGSAGVVHSPPE